jgi:hypothetical protein
VSDLELLDDDEFGDHDLQLDDGDDNEFNGGEHVLEENEGNAVEVYYCYFKYTCVDFQINFGVYITY